MCKRQTTVDQIRVVPYEWSAYDSPSSSPPLFEPAHQPSADPRPGKDSPCNQSAAPFMSCELFNGGREERITKDRRQQRCREDQNWTTVEAGERHQPAASQDYPSDFSDSDHLSPAVGDSQYSQNAMLPTQSECARGELRDFQLSVTQPRCFCLINGSRILTVRRDWCYWRAIIYQSPRSIISL